MEVLVLNSNKELRLTITCRGILFYIVIRVFSVCTDFSIMKSGIDFAKSCTFMRSQAVISPPVQLLSWIISHLLITSAITFFGAMNAWALGKYFNQWQPNNILINVKSALNCYLYFYYNLSSTGVSEERIFSEFEKRRFSKKGGCTLMQLPNKQTIRPSVCRTLLVS